MAMELEIRREAPGEAQAIDCVVSQAFQVAPHASGTEQFIVRQLRSSGALTVSLVAVSRGRVVGHVAISPVTVSDGSAGWFGIGPVAVLPQEQGRGVGRRLVELALDNLRAMGAEGCVVLGDPGYYGRFGFRVDPNLTLEGVPPEYFQALAFRGARARGSVTYHPAFSSTA
jgi:putative acetyltransferase